MEPGITSPTSSVPGAPKPLPPPTAMPKVQPGITTPTQPSGVGSPATPTPVSTKPNLQGMASALPEAWEGKVVRHMGGQAAGDLYDTFKQHGVPQQDRQSLLQDFQKLQQSSQQGNYFNTYQNAMGLMGRLKSYNNPNLVGAIAPIIQQHQGGMAPTMWHLANAWHGMVGNPGQFAKLTSMMAPGLMRTAGQFGGAAGPLALYGLASGNRQVLDDLKTLVSPSKPAM